MTFLLVHNYYQQPGGEDGAAHYRREMRQRQERKNEKPR
jgi:hypothetical protein